MNWLLALVLVLSAFFLGSSLEKPSVSSNPAPQVTASPIPVKTELDSEKLWSLIQNWRQSEGLKPYIKDQRLCKLASTRLEQIKIDWSHDQFVPTVRKQFSKKMDYEIGENLASDFRNEKSLLDDWLESPSHLANLKERYTYSCIEIDKWNAVQIFANF